MLFGSMKRLAVVVEERERERRDSNPPARDLFLSMLGIGRKLPALFTNPGPRHHESVGRSAPGASDPHGS